TFDGVVEPVGSQPILGPDLRCDHPHLGRRGEQCIHIASQAVLIVGECHRRSPYDEQLRPNPVYSEALGELLTKLAHVARAELSCGPGHARSIDRPVMKIPRSRNARGLSRSASAWKMPGTAGYQRFVRRSGPEVHIGTGQRSRAARWSAKAANAASSSCAPVSGGSCANTSAASVTPPRRRAEL